MPHFFQLFIVSRKIPTCRNIVGTYIASRPFLGRSSKVVKIKGFSSAWILDEEKFWSRSRQRRLAKKLFLGPSQTGNVKDVPQVNNSFCLRIVT